jgi:hypothetical protein
MKTKNLILFAIVLLIVLVLIDLLTGIFYWNRLYLVFDSGNFNNIVTPVVSILALVTYAGTLFHLINQNQIALSQSLKPFYEKELDELLKKASMISVEAYNGNETINYSVYNFIEGIKLSFSKLQNFDSFKRDTKQSESGYKFNVEDIETRNYFKFLDTLHQFSNTKNSVLLLLSEVVNLFKDVSNSKLIEEDKALFQEKLLKIFLSDYLNFIESMKKDTNNKYPICPFIYDDGDERIEFKKLYSTQFGKAYEDLKIN